MRWDPPVTSRDQLVLFSDRLDEVLPADHLVRRLDEVLDLVDFKDWERAYHQHGPGRPPIHPRVMASIILYGLMVRIRASRQLEDALRYRLDFRWLAEGRVIDHTTLSIFRRENGDHLKKLFVQLGLIAHRAGLITLRHLIFDGTKVRANNRRQGSRSVKELLVAREELGEKFDEFMRLSHEDDERLDSQEKEELEDLELRRGKIAKALEEIDQLEEDEEPLPKRLPLTDPESRITPNKEGGFGPNYTPLAAVDADSGMVVSADLIADGDEKKRLFANLDETQNQFNVQPQAVLADGHFSNGSTLAEMNKRGLEFYSPTKTPNNNPAIRDDPTTVVPEDRWDALPSKKVQGQTQLDKQAFVYDAQTDCYYCPQGKALKYRSTTPEKRTDGTVSQRRRYEADPKDCASCLLQNHCFRGKSKFRRISRDQFDPLREELVKRMESEDGRKIYAQRAPVGERPFAVIKQIFGLRQFLTRGLKNVTNEWLWAVTTFNLRKLIHYSRYGPSPTQS